MEKGNSRKGDDHRQDSSNSKAYIQAIKQFLATFKTQPCDLQYEHDLNICSFHHGQDQRRNPYLNNSFAYFTDIQSLRENNKSEKDCPEMLCSNDTQYIYHPLIYKTQRCMNFYNCELGILCPHLHSEDQKAFEYGQFFRFNINTHKTKPCPRRENHQRKTCIYYHTEMDRRRPNFKQYSYELCPKKHCKDNNCIYSHNKIEQVYHPVRYKTKFCKSYTNKSNRCQYKQFCGFAHTQNQIKVEMIHLLVPDHDFYLRKYKTVWCPDTSSHDRSNCVYAHNIQDFRRDPFLHPFYDSQKCSNWNFEEELKSIEDSGCKAGMQCTKCHGWMEQRYHPQVFKKNKFNQNKQMTNLLDKKLNSLPKQKAGQTRGISSVVQDKMVKPSVNVHSGAPFFKKQASQSSRRSKAITTNIQSDDSCRDEQPKIFSLNPTNSSSSIRKKSMFLFSQEQIWSHQQDNNNQFQKKLNQERARSESKFDECDTVYSHSLKQTIGNSSLLRKLKDNNINELKIKNLCQKQIQELRFLDKQEKQLLTNKARLYQLRRQKNPVIYSLQLAKFFISKKQGVILQKTRTKKIKEQQLLKMKKKQIMELDFLTLQQKQMLPKLIEEFNKFCTEKQFSQINEEINKLVTPRPRNSHVNI